MMSVSNHPNLRSSKGELLLPQHHWSTRSCTIFSVEELGFLIGCYQNGHIYFARLWALAMMAWVSASSAEAA